MNKKLLLAMALTAFTATIVNARSWRINNDVTKMAHFTDINAAMKSADVVAGDTLYLDPGASISNDQNVTKQVTIIGCGYTGAILPHGFAYISGKLNLNAANTKVLGVYISNDAFIAANYVTLERCRIRYIHTNNKPQYCIIRNCYIYNGSSYNPCITGPGYDSSYASFWTIENSIIYYDNSNNYECIGYLYNATIRNNLIINARSGTRSYCLFNVVNSQIINNIIITKKSEAFSGVSTVSTDQLNNNVLSSNTRPDYNRCNVLTTDSVFTGDYQEYVLTDDSPAKGYGQDGKDCGIFGGLYPYVKGGRPYGHPYFEQYNVSSRPEEGKVNVSLKIKTQNE